MKTTKVNGYKVVEFNEKDNKFKFYKYIEKNFQGAVYAKFSYDHLLTERRLNTWIFLEDGTILKFKFKEAKFANLDWIKDCIETLASVHGIRKIKLWRNFHL